jgi:hypothetical protein
MTRSVLVLACCVAVLLAPATATAIAPAEAVRLLNLQRSANGLPGDLVEAPGLSDGCSKHANYVALNGGVPIHGEDPGKPGYTPAGDGQTLESSGPEVLSSAASWSDSTNPWLLAPIHLYLVFDPEVAVAGYSDDHGVGCMRVRGGRAPASGPELYSLPGSGRTGVPISELNHESPYTPQQLAGIPAGQATGPNILLFTRGLRGSRPLAAAAFSLTGPDGPVDARLVIEGTSNAVGSGSWFRGGGVLIPVAPLAPFATYVGRVTWHRDIEGTVPAADVEQVVTFETAGLPNDIDVSVRSSGDVNVIHVTTAAPNPTLKLTGPGHLTAAVALKGGSIRYAGLDPGPWTACANSGGKAVGYRPVSVCKPFTASARVMLELARERGRTSVALTVPRIARGRRAQVTVSSYKLACSTGKRTPRRCTRKAIGRADRFGLALSASQMRLRLPSRQDGVKVGVRVVLPRFAIGDAPYLRTDLRRSWE